MTTQTIAAHHAPATPAAAPTAVVASAASKPDQYSTLGAWILSGLLIAMAITIAGTFYLALQIHY